MARRRSTKVVTGDSELESNLPARIRRLRAKLHLAQEHLTQRIGVSFATVNRWERGHRKPIPLACQRISELERGVENV